MTKFSYNKIAKIIQYKLKPLQTETFISKNGYITIYHPALISKTNCRQPSYSWTFYLHFRMFTVEKIIYFPVKNGLYNCKFRICGSKLQNLYTGNNEGKLYLKKKHVYLIPTSFNWHSGPLWRVNFAAKRWLDIFWLRLDPFSVLRVEFKYEMSELQIVVKILRLSRSRAWRFRVTLSSGKVW